MHDLSREHEAPICGKDFKTGQTLIKTILAPGFKARMLGLSGMVLDQHPRQPRRRSARRSRLIQDQGRIEAVGAGAHPAAGALSRTCTGISRTRFALTITRHAVIIKKVGTTSTSSDGLAIRCRSRSISCAVTRFWLRRSCSTSYCSSTWRSALRNCKGLGIQEWLSFYFKVPMTAPGLYPEHDLFIQLMKLKNTLRHLRGEELITHLGLEYYD